MIFFLEILFYVNSTNVFANFLEKFANFWILKILKILKKKALIHKFNCTPPPKKQSNKKRKKKKKLL